ncbi:hypothetical protein [Caulobacter sp. 17J65-9]|uniref:hypothetical protein n=1 Tax=Caulobacter sp. 17J65-9 TaxID=2709382 RepID=UPI0013C97A25|nr:hypothetical protein [Caulobacter sp. 17J65-9]NEX94850.1 hypothetical protein [Caulobacter sp. 17J65-9]
MRALLGAVLILALAAPVAAGAAAGDVGGVYLRSKPAAGEMRIKRAGAAWRIDLTAGSPPMGAATSADCSLAAVGPLKDGKIVADFVPFENDLMSVTAADLAGKHRRVVVAFDGAVAKVVSADISGSCGWNADVTGAYKRKG